MVLKPRLAQLALALNSATNVALPQAPSYASMPSASFPLLIAHQLVPVEAAGAHVVTQAHQLVSRLPQTLV